MKKLVIPKETTFVKEFASMFIPGKPGKRNKYLNRGLIGRNVKPGVYRFEREDGKPLNVIAFMVRISEPWCNKVTWTLVRTCSTHGDMCPLDDNEKCDVEMIPTKVKKWSALASLHDERHLNVSLYKLAGSMKKQGHYKPASGVGFAVCLVLRSN